MAAIWSLPVIFVLENNHYAVSTNVDDVIKVKDLSQRAQGYGMPGVRVDGFDAIAVYEAAAEAVARARRGDGPTLLVTECYRLEGHYAGEPEVYRSRDEVKEYWQREPLARFRRDMTAAGQVTDAELDAIDAEVKQEIADAVEFAKNSPAPDPETAMEYIYA
jgi:pyruvate dehydrogenase E1 component alpha subunit